LTEDTENCLMHRGTTKFKDAYILLAAVRYQFQAIVAYVNQYKKFYCSLIYNVVRQNINILTRL
jgi:hypothetical protein